MRVLKASHYKGDEEWYSLYNYLHDELSKRRLGELKGCRRKAAAIFQNNVNGLPKRGRTEGCFTGTTARRVKIGGFQSQKQPVSSMREFYLPTPESWALRSELPLHHPWLVGAAVMGNSSRFLDHTRMHKSVIDVWNSQTNKYKSKAPCSPMRWSYCATYFPLNSSALLSIVA